MVRLKGIKRVSYDSKQLKCQTLTNNNCFRCSIATVSDIQDPEIDPGRD